MSEPATLSITATAIPLLLGAMGKVKVAAIGGLASLVFWEFNRAVGGRRHRPARDHSWLSRQIHAPGVQYDADRELWIVNHADGRQTLTGNKRLAEMAIDADRHRTAIHFNRAARLIRFGEEGGRPC